MSAASGSPRAAMSSCWRAMSAVSSPRRRWVGSTPTALMPAHGRAAGPGTVSPNERMAAVATMRPPSRTARLRSRSNVSAAAAISSSSMSTPNTVSSTAMNWRRSRSSATGWISTPTPYPDALRP